MNIEFKPLGAEDIEVKVKQVGAKGAVALLYKTARTDMNVLDEVVGKSNWQDSYHEIKGNLYCAILIWDDEKGQWISKEDCGIESREDEEGNQKKGEASDAFKRAGVQWGIGRELYTAPFIFLNVPTEDTGKKNKAGKPIYELQDQYARYDLKEIAYQNGRISRLAIVDKNDKVVYQHGGKPEAKTPFTQAAADVAKKIEDAKQENPISTNPPQDVPGERASKEDISRLTNIAGNDRVVFGASAKKFGYAKPSDILKKDVQKIADDLMGIEPLPWEQGRE